MKKQITEITYLYESTPAESAEEKFGRDLLKLASEGWYPYSETPKKKGLLRRRSALKVKYRPRTTSNESDIIRQYQKPNLENLF